MSATDTICPYCLKHIRYVPLHVHERRCPARLAGQEAHSPQQVAFARHLQGKLVIAGQQRDGAPP